MQLSALVIVLPDPRLKPKEKVRIFRLLFSHQYEEEDEEFLDYKKVSNV